MHVLYHNVQGDCNKPDEQHAGQTLAYVNDTESFIVLVRYIG